MTDNPLARLSESLLATTSIPLLVMMVHVTLDVILKYTVNTPIHGTLEIVAYYYMVSIVVLPLAFIELTRQSIAVDLFYQAMPRRMQVGVIILVLLVSVAGYAMLAWISWFEALEAFKRRQIVMGAVRVIIWPTKFLLPISFLLVAAVCLLHIFRLIVSPQAREDLLSVHVADVDNVAVD